MYQALLKRGVQFPNIPKAAAAQNPQGGQGGSQGASASAPEEAKQSNNNADSKGGSGRAQAGSIPAKFEKLVEDMNLVKGNINFTNEIIDQLQPGEKSETLNDLFRTLTQLEPKLINMIS